MRGERTVTKLWGVWWKREIVVIFEMCFECRVNRRSVDGLHMSYEIKRGLDDKFNFLA